MKVDLLLNGEQVDALSFIVHREKAYARARKICEKLKENIPRQLFEVPVPGGHRRQDHRPGDRQSHAQGRAGKCYGGDISPEKEAAGRSRKRAEKDAGRWEPCKLPTEAFMAVLKLDE